MHVNITACSVDRSQMSNSLICFSLLGFWEICNNSISIYQKLTCSMFIVDPKGSVGAVDKVANGKL